MDNTTPTPNDLLIHQDKGNVINPLAKYEYLRMSASKPVVAPIPTISINGLSIGTQGNIVVLSGPPKAGKSALSNVILAGAIRPPGGTYDGFQGLEVAENTNGKAVLHFDLEQSKYHHFKAMQNSVLKRTNLTIEPDHFLSYNLRELSIKQYPIVCKDIFKEADALFKGIHLAVFDGGADFLNSVNDEVSSNIVVKFFEDLAVRYKTTIVVIIHFNPNSEKQRGHLGSQLQRKAESVLAVKKNGSVSYIEPQFLRGADGTSMPLIQFQYDNAKGYHTGDGFLIKLNKEEQNEDQLKKWAVAVFSDVPLSHADAILKLIPETGLAERSVNYKIKDMLTLGLIEKNKSRQYILKSSGQTELGL